MSQEKERKKVDTTFEWKFTRDDLAKLLARIAKPPAALRPAA